MFLSCVRVCRRAGLFALAASLSLTTALSPVMAAPQGGAITNGSGAISQNGANTLITQNSDRLVIEWQSFDTISGESVTFAQPGSSAWALNRVLSGQATHFDGSLFANGNVVITNGAGIHFGPNAFVDVGTLIASVPGITDSNFLSGKFIFDQPGNADAMVTNAGTITVKDQGLAALVAPGVENSGLIQANLGTVILGAGETHTLDFYGDGLVQFAIGEPTKAAPKRADGSDADALVSNSGEVKADGGTVIMTAKQASRVLDTAINMSGVAQANSVSTRGGKIILGGGSSGKVRVSGTVHAQSAPAAAPTPADPIQRGTVKITGETVEIASGAEIDVSGTNGGGTVLIGGDYQGATIADEQLADLANASSVTIESGATIYASATENGDGGTVIAWADGTTVFNGAIRARGGDLGGNGGFVETSGKDGLGVGASASVDALAPNGEVGDWLLDPRNITIADGGTGTLTQAADASDTTTDLIVDASTINAAGANVTLAATETITFNEAIAMTNAGVGLTATGDSIVVNTSVATNNGDISLIADHFDINAAVNAGTGSILFDRATLGNFGLGFNGGSGVATLNTTELGLLTAGSLIIGDPNAAQNKINQLDFQNTFDLSGNISGLVQLNALSSAAAYVTSSGSQTFQAVEYNAADGVTFVGDNTVTTTTGGAVFNADADGTTAGSNGFNDFRAQGGDVAVNSGADIVVNTRAYTETGTGTFTLNANSGAGTISIERSSDGTIGVGTGSGGDINISDAQLSRMSAATLNFGDTVNTSSVLVDGGDYTGLGTLSFTTTAAGTISLEDSAENYTFDALETNSGTANIGAAITTSGAQNYNGAVVLIGDSTLSSTGAGDITFDGTIDGGFGLTVNTAGTTGFNGLIGNTTSLGSLTTDAGGSSVFNINGTTQVSIQNEAFFGDDVSISGNSQIWEFFGNATFDGTVGGNVQILMRAHNPLTFNDAVEFLAFQVVSGGLVTINGGSVTTTGNAFPLDIQNNLILGADTVFSSQGPIIFRRTVDGAFAMTLNSPRRTVFRGVVGGITPLTSITTDAGGTMELEGGSINVTGNTIFNDAVSLWVDTTITNGGDVTFNSTVDSQSGETNALTVNAGGTTTFNGAVGTTDALSSLTTDAAGTTVIDGGSVETTGNQTYNDALIIASGTTLDSGGDIAFNATVDSESTETNDLTIDAANVAFNGVVGRTDTLAALDVTADTLIAVAANVSASNTIAFDAPTVNLDANLTATNGISGTATTVNVLGSTGGAQLNDAVDVAAANATVNVLGGTYNTAGGVILDVAGMNFRNVDNLTDLNIANNAVVAPTSPGFTIAANGVTLDGFSYSGTAGDPAILLTAGANNVDILNGVITGTALGGAGVLVDAGVTSALNLLIDNVTMTGVTGRGVHFDNALSGGALVFIQNSSISADGAGIQIDEGIGAGGFVVVSGNTITASGDGVGVYDTIGGALVIEDSAITSLFSTGVRIGDVTGTVVIGGASPADSNTILGVDSGVQVGDIDGGSVVIANNDSIVGTNGDGIAFFSRITDSLVEVRDNSLIRGGNNGILFTWDGPAEINNSLINITDNGAIIGQTYEGISVDAWIRNGSEFSVTSNDEITGEADGIGFYGPITLSSVDISGNTLIQANTFDAIYSGGLLALSQFRVTGNGQIIGAEDALNFEPVILSLVDISGNGLVQGVSGSGIEFDAPVVLSLIAIDGNSQIRGGEFGIEFDTDFFFGQGPAIDLGVIASVVSITNNPEIVGETEDGILINNAAGSRFDIGNSAAQGAQNGLNFDNNSFIPLNGLFNVDNMVVLTDATLTGSTGAGLDVRNHTTEGGLEIDLAGGNVFTGTPSMFLSGPRMALTGDTLSDTRFVSVGGGNYIVLANTGLFDPGQPTYIDGYDAYFDGIQANGATVMGIEARIVDYDDDNTLGQIFTRNAVDLSGAAHPLDFYIRLTNIQSPGDYLLRPIDLENIISHDILDGGQYGLGACAIVADPAGWPVYACIDGPGPDISPFLADFMAGLPMGDLASLN